MLLETENEMNVVGEATTGQEVLDLITNGQKIDLVLADINMPVMDGIELIKALRVKNPEIRIVVLSMLDNEKYVAQAFVEGASGYLLKNVSSDELIFCLKHVSIGGRYLCSELAVKLLDKLVHSSVSPLTYPEHNIEFSTREIEVLHLIAEGLTNNEMSDKLFISKRTIEGHRQSLLEKTGSRNTATLIKFAVLNGIIQ